MAESVAQVAGRILTAWRNGEGAGLGQELERAAPSSTREIEALDALTGVVESLGQGRQERGAVRLLEHLAGDPKLSA